MLEEGCDGESLTLKSHENQNENCFESLQMFLILKFKKKVTYLLLDAFYIYSS